MQRLHKNETEAGFLVNFVILLTQFVQVILISVKGFLKKLQLLLNLIHSWMHSDW